MSDRVYMTVTHLHVWTHTHVIWGHNSQSLVTSYKPEQRDRLRIRKSQETAVAFYKKLIRLWTGAEMTGTDNNNNQDTKLVDPESLTTRQGKKIQGVPGWVSLFTESGIKKSKRQVRKRWVVRNTLSVSQLGRGHPRQAERSGALLSWKKDQGGGHSEQQHYNSSYACAVHHQSTNGTKSQKKTELQKDVHRRNLHKRRVRKKSK